MAVASLASSIGVSSFFRSRHNFRYELSNQKEIRSALAREEDSLTQAFEGTERNADRLISTRGDRLPKDEFVSPKYKDPWGSSRFSKTRFVETKEEPEQKVEEARAIEQVVGKLRSIKYGVSTRVASESRLGNLVKLLKPPGSPSDSMQNEDVEKRTEEPPKFPWEMENPPRLFPDEERQSRSLRAFPPSLAEVVIPDAELRRLRTQMIGMTERLKLRKTEVSNAVVRGIHERWKYSELVQVKCEGAPAQNMRRMHEELEKRTGGLVIWRSGGALVLYRGKEYLGPPAKPPKDTPPYEAKESGNNLNHVAEEEKDLVDVSGMKYDRQMDELLEGLGPRYTDWTGCMPVPVDGDKLPEIDHTYKAPYRLLPYGVEAKLTDMELINLRRVAKTTPPHFVLSRSHGLQGLAHAMVKLWEKSEVTIVSIKPKPRTNLGRMADELKSQTRGILIWRDAASLVFYRGKDFLPQAVATRLEEREFSCAANHEAEENARILPTSRMPRSIVHTTTPKEAEADLKLQEWVNTEHEQKRRALAAKSVRAVRARRIEARLEQAWEKKAKAETAIQKLERLIERRRPTVDQETITEEERYMLLKLGLKMRAALELGRRGVFSGIVENMHLHWKYRDVVKVIYKGKDRADIDDTARMLEIESGGILVGIVPTFKGAALLYYRGKNYKRPAELRPKTLLTKRKALELHTANQQRQSLAQHILSLEEDIKSLGYMLEKTTAVDKQTGVVVEKFVKKEMNEQELEALDPAPRKRFTADDLGPVVKADPLTNRERLILRKKALLNKKPNHFNIGKLIVPQSLIVAIRLHLHRHELVKIGVKGRPVGTSVQEIVKLIEEGTGAAFVCVEQHKLIFYRGWAEENQYPAYMEENLSEELISAVREEDLSDSYHEPEHPPSDNSRGLAGE